MTPERRSSVGQVYSNFTQVTDDDVVDYLNRPVTNPQQVRDEEVSIDIDIGVGVTIGDRPDLAES
ncbi:MAG: hypothetical protein ACYC0U_05565 [Ilumatobacteraceae bacterium]